MWKINTLLKKNFQNFRTIFFQRSFQVFHTLIVSITLQSFTNNFNNHIFNMMMIILQDVV